MGAGTNLALFRAFLRLTFETYRVLRSRLYSWHNVANVVYVDQPVGTGLSYTTKGNYADNDLQVGTALVACDGRR